MGCCLIFCAAEFDGLARPVGPEDCILSADGGLRHLEALGLRPREMLGDFDSLGYVPPGAAVFPVEKDDTDAMIAARRGLALGYREFLFYGALDGPRLDHTVANFQTLQFLADRGAAGYLVGKRNLVTVLRNGRLCFPAEATGILSLFCLGPDAAGIWLKGLRYPLENAVLRSNFPLGVSNHFTGVPAEVTVENGSLLAMWDRENGFPRRDGLE